MTFNSVGVRWSSIQWLVAALGVGLGFGLQEIFANFISGLILLFEQPIRVGDVITLGETTGSVSRIRMRATTITNFDRQELIIPIQGFDHRSALELDAQRFDKPIETPCIGRLRNDTKRPARSCATFAPTIPMCSKIPLHLPSLRIWEIAHSC